MESCKLCGRQGARRKVAAFRGWHEPDKSRGLRPLLWEPRGEMPRGYSALPLLMKVLIDVGDEEREKIALFQILVLVAKIPPYCKQ